MISDRNIVIVRLPWLTYSWKQSGRASGLRSNVFLVQSNLTDPTSNCSVQGAEPLRPKKLLTAVPGAHGRALSLVLDLHIQYLHKTMRGCTLHYLYVSSRNVHHITCMKQTEMSIAWPVWNKQRCASHGPHETSIIVRHMTCMKWR